MTGKMLSKVGASLVRRFGTRDPFQIAKELGISVLLCEDFGSLKGMYRVITQSIYFSEQGSGGQNAPHRLCP